MPAESTPSHDVPGDRQSPAPGRLLSRLAWLATAALGAFFSVRILLAVKSASQDSWFPLSRALDFVHGGSPDLVYRTLLFTQHVKFQYPPTGLLIFDLLRWLGIHDAYQYNLIGAVLLIATGLAFARLAIQTLPATSAWGIRVPLAPLAFVLALRYFPTHFAFDIGQVQVLLGLLFLLAVLAQLQGRSALAGVLMAVAATIKPQFLLFGALAAWRRDWRFLFAFGALTAAATAVAIGLYGWKAQLSYYLEVLPFLSQHGECYHTNQSVNGILHRYLDAAPCIDADPHADPLSPVLSSWFPPYVRSVYLATVASSLALIAAAFSLWRLRRNHLTQALYFCLAGILFTMASPIAWLHHYNVLLPVFVISLAVALERWEGARLRIAQATLAVSLVLTGLPLAAPNAPTIRGFSLAQSHLFIGAVLLLALVLAQLIASRDPPTSHSSESPA